jgi:hypothetical protein
MASNAGNNEIILLLGAREHITRRVIFKSLMSFSIIAWQPPRRLKAFWNKRWRAGCFAQERF